MKKLFVALPLLAAFCLADSPTTQPAKPASKELLEKVQKDLADVTSVEADFVQEKEMAMLKHKLVIKGHFAMEKPDHVVWNVVSPVKYAIEVKGEQVTQWDEDTNKVQVIHLGGDPTFKAISEQISAWFLGDYQKIAEQYDISVAQDSPLTLSFSPKAGSMVGKMMKDVSVTFGKEGKYIDTMIIREASGSVTTLHYLDAKINQPIAKTTWEIPPHAR